MTDIRIYRLKITQLQERNDAREFLLARINVGDCIEIPDFANPASNGFPLRWPQIVVRVNGDDCWREFHNRVHNQDLYFKLRHNRVE